MREGTSDTIQSNPSVQSGSPCLEPSCPELYPVLSIFKDGDPAPRSPGQLVPVFDYPQSEEVFSYVSFMSICVHCLLSFDQGPLRRACLHLLCTLPSDMDKIPLKLPFSRLSSSSSLSFLTCEVLQSLSCLCDPLLDPFHYAMSLLYWGPLNWTHYPSHATSSLSRGGKSSPSTCWQCSSQCSPGGCWPSLLWWCVLARA